MGKSLLSYPAKISSDKDQFLVTFRDLPNVFSCGESEQEAIFNAQEALDLVLEEMHQDNLEIEWPSKIKKDEVMLPVSPDIAVPVLLRNLRNKRKYTYTEVAKIMGISYQSYQQIELGKNITLKTLKKAAMALGATVEVSFLTNT